MMYAVLSLHIHHLLTTGKLSEVSTDISWSVTSKLDGLLDVTKAIGLSNGTPLVTGEKRLQDNFYLYIWLINSEFCWNFAFLLRSKQNLFP